MKKFKLFFLIVCIIAASTQIYAQQGGNSSERFYNVDSYKADVTLTFEYRFSESDAEYSRSVVVSQRFGHTFITTPGQTTAADMFQVERGDEAKNESHEGDIMHGVDMSAVSEAMENSGLDPSVMDMLKQTKGETQSFHVSFDKYKMWMANPVSGGKVSTSIVSEFLDEASGIMHCGEGQGSGRFTTRKKYQGNEKINAGAPNNINQNSFIFQLNLDNNSYSFSASVKVPQGFKFEGNELRTECGTSTDEAISLNARNFISIRAEKEGLIYKNPLPKDGMILSGSKIITDRFNLWSSLEKEGDWTVRIEWSIYPLHM